VINQLTGVHLIAGTQDLDELRRLLRLKGAEQFVRRPGFCAH
jgi:hypothetical protein